MHALPRSLIALVWLLSVFASIRAMAADDAAVHLPPLYNSFIPPTLSGSYTDSVFGVSIKRLSDAPNTYNNAVPGQLSFVSTEYPTASPFNSDNTLLILQHQGYFGLYDGEGSYLQDLPFAVNAATEPRWSRTDPNALYYVSGNALMKLDVPARTSSIVHSFGEYAAIRGRGESDISRDGDHFVFAADELSTPSTPGLLNRYVFVYEISTNTKGAVLDTSGHAFNNLYIAPNNGVALGWIATGTTRFTGVEFFNRNMVFQRQLTHAIGHMHLTRDGNGDDLAIWTNSNDSQPIANCQNGIVKVRLADARQTCLLQLDWSLAVHITAPDGNGWVFVETYDPLDPAPSAPGWKTYTNEILQVKLDGTEIRRLVHHRSRQTANYGFQPRATMSRDGSRLVFTSNFDLQAILGYPSTYTDAYLVTIPAMVPPHLAISDASVFEGNSGTSSLVFTVSLSYASDLPISVDYATADVRATAPGDYAAIPATTLSFAPGETLRTIVVSVNGDLQAEPAETLFVNLTNAVNVVVDDGVGLGTIADDESPTGDGLKGVYFNTMNLSGSGQTRVDPTVDFDWGTGSPGFGGLGADHISIRWMGRVESPLTETYSFCTRTDDGVRLWVNHVLLVDRWVDQGFTQWCGSIALQAGYKYDIRMEYYEDMTGASAQLLWSSPSTPMAIVPQARLYSRYPIDHRRTIGDQGAIGPSLSDAPATRAGPATGAADAPASSLAALSGSSPQGTLVARSGAAAASVSIDSKAEPARNPLTNRGRGGSAIAASSGEAGDGSERTEEAPGDGLEGAYFATATLSGPSQNRVDLTVDFEWGLKPPGIGGRGAGQRSVRWTGRVKATFTETYTFCTSTDDGVRLWINGEAIVDQWIDQPATEWCGSISLQGGRKYELKMEYYQSAGFAVARLFWSSPSTPRAIIPRAQLYSTRP